MKLIDSSVELLTQEPGFTGILKHIEKIARTCYKSENKITEDSAVAFVDNLINRQHYAMLEHGTVYLKLEYWKDVAITELASIFRYNPYSKVVFDGSPEDPTWWVTTNLRVLKEKNLVEICQPFMVEPTDKHQQRISLKFITSIGITRELIRHRVFSFANESTRYCNYGADKFDNELTFIRPTWTYHDIDNKNHTYYFMDCLKKAEHDYLAFVSNGLSPQEAREVLPLATKSEIVMTGFLSDWKHFFNLRYFGTTGKPHPDMLELTTKAKALVEAKGLWDLIHRT